METKFNVVRLTYFHNEPLLLLSHCFYCVVPVLFKGKALRRCVGGGLANPNIQKQVL